MEQSAGSAESPPNNTSGGGSFQRWGSTVRAKSAELPLDVKEMLETEQQLCDRLKENYEVLKRKYRDLQAEYGSLNRQFLDVNRRKLDELHYQKDLEKVGGDLQEKVSFLETEHRKSRERFESFKSATKAELREEYGTVIGQLSAELEEFKRKYCELAREKAQLEALAGNLAGHLKSVESSSQQKVRDLNEEKEDEKKELLKRIQDLSGDSDQAKIRKQLETDNKRLSEKLSKVIQESASEKEILSEKLRKTAKDLKIRENEVNKLEELERKLKFELAEARKSEKMQNERLEKLQKSEENVQKRLQKSEFDRGIQDLDWEKRLDALNSRLQENKVDSENEISGLRRRILERDARISELEEKILAKERKEEEVVNMKRSEGISEEEGRSGRRNLEEEIKTVAEQR